MDKKLPATGTAHTLPFEKLSPIDFERLCLWLVRREGYEDAEHFGAKGSDQGRDVVAMREGRRVVVQCKRVERFGPAEAEKEVAKLLGLPPETQPQDVVFMVTATVTAATRDRALAAWGDRGSCAFWAGTELDERVKRHPEILKNFFGPIPVNGGGQWRLRGAVILFILLLILLYLSPCYNPKVEGPEPKKTPDSSSNLFLIQSVPRR